MKKRLISIIAVIVAMVMLATVSTSAVTYRDYQKLTYVWDTPDCTSMQGIAVGSRYIYTVKAKAEKNNDPWTRAVIHRTDTQTNECIKLINGAAKNSDDKYIFNNLGHANDMCVTDVQGKSTLFVTGADKKIVALQISGTTVKQYATYTLKCNGSVITPSGIALYKNGSVAKFLIKSGEKLYTTNINKALTGNNTISASYAFSINRINVKIDGETRCFAKQLDAMCTEGYDNQGITYYKNKLYVCLSRRWREDIKSNHSTSAILVYENVSDAIKNHTSNKRASENLSFEMYDPTWCLFEIEGCGINPKTGKMYFNTNFRRYIHQWLCTNYDMIASVPNYTA